MSYRPITDLWFLARAKLKPNEDGSKRTYYGAYLGGFPERARVLIGCPITVPMLHVCGGMAKHYPYAGGFGVADETLDLNPACNPTHLQDARDALPRCKYHSMGYWPGILIDPPYSPEDARHYSCGEAVYPKPNELVANAMNSLEIGARVGIIHYQIPGCPKNAKFVACVGVVCGFNNRIRAFSVFERLS